VGKIHGRIVRRAEAGELLFLDDFIKQGRATQEETLASQARHQLNPLFSHNVSKYAETIHFRQPRLLGGYD